MIEGCYLPRASKIEACYLYRADNRCHAIVNLRTMIVRLNDCRANLQRMGWRPWQSICDSSTNSPYGTCLFLKISRLTFGNWPRNHRPALITVLTGETSQEKLFLLSLMARAQAWHLCYKQDLSTKIQKCSLVISESDWLKFFSIHVRLFAHLIFGDSTEISVSLCFSNRAARPG
jgi:hypothetical protein